MVRGLTLRLLSTALAVGLATNPVAANDDANFDFRKIYRNHVYCGETFTARLKGGRRAKRPNFLEMKFPGFGLGRILEIS